MRFHPRLSFQLNTLTIKASPFKNQLILLYEPERLIRDFQIRSLSIRQVVDPLLKCFLISCVQQLSHTNCILSYWLVYVPKTQPLTVLCNSDNGQIVSRSYYGIKELVRGIVMSPVLATRSLKRSATFGLIV